MPTDVFALPEKWRAFKHTSSLSTTFLADAADDALKRAAFELEASLREQPVVRVADLQEALKRALGEDHGVHEYEGDNKKPCRKCGHSRSFILHMDCMVALKEGKRCLCAKNAVRARTSYTDLSKE